MVGGFGHIFLQVDTGELNNLAWGGDVFLDFLGVCQIIERHATSEAER